MVISPHTQGSTPLSFPAVANQHQFHTTPSIPAPISAAVLYSLKQHHNSRQQHLQTTLLTAGLLHNKHSTRTTFFFPTIFLLQLQFLCFKHLISTNSSNTNTKSAQTSSLSSSKLQIKHTAPLTHTCRAPHKTCSSSHSDAFIQSQQAANSSTQPSPCLSPNWQPTAAPSLLPVFLSTKQVPPGPQHSSSFCLVDPRFSSLCGYSPGSTPPPCSRRRPRLPARAPMLLDRRPAAPPLSDASPPSQHGSTSTHRFMRLPSPSPLPPWL